MKKVFLLSVLATVSGWSSAQEVGHVLSSTPVIQPVGVPRQVCTTEQIAVQPPKSGAGAAIGAVAGGAIGSTMGRGPGRAAATVIGAIGGAVIGDRVEGTPEAELRNVQRCGTQTFYENRTVGYSVVYEYAGKQYSVQMPSDPGPTVPLQISPVGGVSSQAPVAAAPIYVEPTPVVIAQPVYPVYYARPRYPVPYYPAVRIDLGYGHWEHGYHHHWH